MKTGEQRLAWAMELCRRAQVRMTPVRQAILTFVASRRTPVSLDLAAKAEGVRGRCEATTVYRTLMMFKDEGLLRQVGTPQKVSYFVLNVPGESSHFLICRRCGEVSELPELKTLTELEQQVVRDRGYSGVYHDLEFYGVCPACRAGRRPSAPRPVPIAEQRR